MKQEKQKASKSQTLGERRVKIDYVPSEDGLVYEIKKKTAELIDLCERMRGAAYQLEKDRAINIAQKKYETACMYAVKANFID